MKSDHNSPTDALRTILGTATTGVPLTSEQLQASRLGANLFHEIPKTAVWKLWSALANHGAKPALALEALYSTGWSVNFPALHKIRGVEQSPLWHPEGTVDIHSGLAADSAVNIVYAGDFSDDERVIIVLGALLHDVGKATHTFHSPSGNISCKGHAKAGVQPARDFLDSIGAPPHIIDAILPIIATHMDARAGGAHAIGPTSTQVHRLLNRLDGSSIEAWAAVVDADLAGRGAGSRPPVGELWIAAARRHLESKRSVTILRGSHLLERGLPVGTVLSYIIQASLRAQQGQEFDDLAGALTWLERHAERLVAEDSRIQAARAPRVRQQKRRPSA